MTFAEITARAEHAIRPLMVKLPPALVSHIYSRSRKLFLRMLDAENIANPCQPDPALGRTFWGIRFNSPIFNAAGMFKLGEAYRTVARQGAGAYLAGTVTPQPRRGNIRSGIPHPFMPYPASGAASNWMGLPNPGAESLARRISNIEKIPGCPVGVSISASPEASGPGALEDLMNAMNLLESAGVDFFELNESCPNVPGHKNGLAALDEHLTERIDYLHQKFLKIRKRNLPVIAKFSTDTDPAQAPELIAALADAGFDGINFGNTSIDYIFISEKIKRVDRENFDYFLGNFGGGISGAPLRSKSLELCMTAAEYIRNHLPAREFRIIRTGGVASPAEFERSLDCGADMAQWFTGYFDAFARHGHQLYCNLYSRMNLPRE
ncbi:MAG: dihydroorotate dehydrogenase [Candidatus Kapaibacterium sp.]